MLCSHSIARIFNARLVTHIRRVAPITTRQLPLFQVRRYAVADGGLKWNTTPSNPVKVQNSINTNVVGVTYTNPLLVAAMENNVEKIKELAATGVNLNDEEHNETALDLAASCGHLDAVKALVQVGADVNYRRKIDQSTAIFGAVQFKQLHILEYMVNELGADINVKAQGGMTVMHYMLTRSTAREWITILVRLGANVNAVRDDGHTLLTSVCSIGQAPLVDELIQCNADVNMSNKGATPLHFAAQTGEVGTLNYLLQCKNIQIEPRYNGGLTPLHLAADFGRLSAVSMLLKAGAKVNNVEDQDALTPLHVAITKGQYDVSKKLLESGAQVNQADLRGWTPLLSAAYNGHTHIIKLLVKHGANLHSVTHNGEGALATAILQERIEAVKVLVEAGASVEGVPYELPGDLQQVLDGCRSEVGGRIRFFQAVSAKQLVNRGGRMEGLTPFLLACNRGDFEMAKTLIDLGANIHARDAFGCNALHLAFVINQPLDLAEMLLAKGFDINEKSTSGETVLHMATRRGAYKTLQYILSKGADKTAIAQNFTAHQLSKSRLCTKDIQDLLE